MTTVLISGPWGPVIEGSTPSVATSMQNVSFHGQQLTTISNSMAPPIVQSDSGVFTFLQTSPLPLHQATGEQTKTFQIPSFIATIPFCTWIPQHPLFKPNQTFTSNPPLLATQPSVFPFQQQGFYGPIPTHLSVYNNMLVQPYLAAQQFNPHSILPVPN